MTFYGDEMIFYSVFCVDCNLAFISKEFHPPCPRCGKRDTVLNHCKEPEKDEIYPQKHQPSRLEETHSAEE